MTIYEAIMIMLTFGMLLVGLIGLVVLIVQIVIK
ncbi:MAG: putative holin-like toxin [Defluviitaleaceae bacterium]|nr:putative holin-like toxin [Defluviitaleaceae bacterium]